MGAMTKTNRPDEAAKTQISIWLTREQYHSLLTLTNELKLSIARSTCQSDIVGFSIAQCARGKGRRDLERFLREKYSATAW
jgi:hypothetical protein